MITWRGTVERVNAVWDFSQISRDDGVGYGDYVEAAVVHPCSAFSLFDHSENC